MFVYKIVFTNHAVYPEHLVLQHASATVLFNNSHSDDDDDDNYDDAAVHGASCIFQIEKLNDLVSLRVYAFSFLIFMSCICVCVCALHFAYRFQAPVGP